MNIESLEIPDIKLISPSVFSDDRGNFMETFNQRLFNEKLRSQISYRTMNQVHRLEF